MSVRNLVVIMLLLTALNAMAWISFRKARAEPPALTQGWNLVSGLEGKPSAYASENSCVTAIWTLDELTSLSLPIWRAYFPADTTYFRNAETFGAITAFRPDISYWVSCL